MNADSSSLGHGSVWLLLGARAGEVAQQRALGTALNKELGLQVVEKQLRPDSSAGAAEFGSPWPDLTISFGRDVVDAARIKRASGGRTRLLQLARPRGVPMAQIDLLVPMPQDRVEDASNVFRVNMPFNFLDPQRIQKAVTTLAPKLGHLPRPWTLLLIGGTSRHFDFDADIAAAITGRANQQARRNGGSLLISTSPRTPADSIEPIRAAIDVPCDFYAFRPDDPDNPLLEYLALADDVIVTGDTSSMIAEAWRSGKPVQVASLPRKMDLRRRLILASRIILPEPVHRVLRKYGFVSAPVDLASWIAGLQVKGLVSELGGAPPTCTYDERDDVDLQRVVTRVRALLAEAPAQDFPAGALTPSRIFSHELPNSGRGGETGRFARF